MGVRRLLLQGVVVSVAVVIGALFVLHKDSSADADVLINRPPSDVWKVVSNSAAYRNWNPFITRVDGDFREGATIRITLGTGPDSIVFKPFCSFIRNKTSAGVAVYGFAASSTVCIASTSQQWQTERVLNRQSLSQDCSSAG
jgi:hypothetical protein